MLIFKTIARCFSLTDIPLQLVSQLLEYVLPSFPHTGLYTSGQTQLRTFWLFARQFPQSKSASLSQIGGGFSLQQLQILEGIPEPWLDPPAFPELVPLFSDPPEHGHGPLHLYCWEKESFLLQLTLFILLIPICHCSLPGSHLSKSCRRFHTRACTQPGRHKPGPEFFVHYKRWPRLKCSLL